MNLFNKFKYTLRQGFGGLKKMRIKKKYWLDFFFFFSKHFATNTSEILTFYKI